LHKEGNMYYPLLRGKQFELLAMRELALTIKKFVPIIEIVRDNFPQIVKAIKALNDNNITPIIIANPSVGALKDTFINDSLDTFKDVKFTYCYRLNSKNSDEISRRLGQLEKDEYWTWIDTGPTVDLINHCKDSFATIIENGTPIHILQRLNKIVLINDAFEKQDRNADYSEQSSYSYLHTEWSSLDKAIGFSDYTTLPKAYREGGGPAYVVTIHLSFIDEDGFNEMSIRHYSSENDGSAANPASKFLEALAKLMTDVNNNNYFIQSSSILEFTTLSEKNHFPGLGHAKKLCVKHHIETTCDYLIKHRL
jgi:hypothetical protein